MTTEAKTATPETAALHIINVQHWSKERQEWLTFRTGQMVRLLTPTEAKQLAKNELAKEREGDPSFGGLVPVYNTKHRARVRRVEILDDYMVE